MSNVVLMFLLLTLNVFTLNQYSLNNLLRKILRLSTISAWSVLYPFLILLRHVHVPANRNKTNFYNLLLLLILISSSAYIQHIRFLITYNTREQKNFNLNLHKSLNQTVSNSDALRNLLPFA